ncbi:MAG: hypothetical protein QXQ81_02920 [Candidatus Thorarchaeota archaeon]
MQSLERIIVQGFNRKRFVIRRRFRSRKNTVLHIRVMSDSGPDGDIVAKLFEKNTLSVERDVLLGCTEAGIPVPRLIAADNDVILMEYVPGANMVDLINCSYAESMIDALAEWYHRFHHSMKRNRGDSILRNFIWTHRGVVGVDFEESASGEWIDDIAGIAASLLDTDPVFDVRKRALAWRLLDRYLACLRECRTRELERVFVERVADCLSQTAGKRNSVDIHLLSERVRRRGF